MFSTERSAQIAAEFARREGGKINIVKLVKLIYLSDRKCMEVYGRLITYDHLVSMDLGPVPSQTYDLMKGSKRSEWLRWIKGRKNHDVIVQDMNFTRQDLDDLSQADMSVIDEIWNQFGRLNQWELSQYTHDNCPEWEYPERSSSPIHERDIFESFGWSREDAEEAEQAIREQRYLDRQFQTV